MDVPRIFGLEIPLIIQALRDEGLIRLLRKAFFQVAHWQKQNL